MLRFLSLTLVVTALVPLGPLGCPPTDTPLDGFTPVERGTIPTTATAPPTANVGDTVRLDATATPPADGGTVVYAWLQTAGAGVPISNALQASATFVAPSVKSDQTLRFMVTTSDEAGDVGRAEVTIAITADPNFGKNSGQSTPGRPVANAGNDQSVLPGVVVTLDGSGSTGTGLTYQWRQVSGTSVTLTGTDPAKMTFTAPAFSAGGTNVLLFELAVTDSGNHTVTDRTQVTIRDPNAKPTQVKIATSKGDFVVELDADKAPVTVANFLQYVDDKFYDGTIFHRVIKGFVIQGGGFTPDLTQKTTRNPIVNEANNGLSNIRGTIAMARTSAPNSATSQFFVNVADNIKGGDGQSDLDPGGVDPAGYAVFGHVVSGMDVVDAINAVATGSKNGMSDVPVQDVLINSITRVQ